MTSRSAGATSLSGEEQGRRSRKKQRKKKKKKKHSLFLFFFFFFFADLEKNPTASPRARARDPRTGSRRSSTSTSPWCSAPERRCRRACAARPTQGTRATSTSSSSTGPTGRAAPLGRASRALGCGDFAFLIGLVLIENTRRNGGLSPLHPSVICFASRKRKRKTQKREKNSLFLLPTRALR